MFAFVADWFRGLRRASPSASGAAPETSIAYKPSLVDELQAEHCRLVELYQQLVVAHQHGDYDASVAHLKYFTYALRAHLLKENLHLYMYLKHALRHDPELANVMASMRGEMGRIGRTLNDFVTRYTSSPWDAEARKNLLGELSAISEILMHRIRHEEEVLYPMYMPPGSYR
ncbi:MAG: hemerythrin domain-containing protein [Rhodanobacteraceae bacterium]